MAYPRMEYDFPFPVVDIKGQVPSLSLLSIIPSSTPPSPVIPALS